MWQIFKQSVWDFVLGKVVSVLGVVGTAQTLIALVNPSYVITIAGVVKIDYRTWFTFTLVLLVAIILRILYVAAKYKRLWEGTESIRLVYNEGRYAACREVVGGIETIRVGCRVKGKKIVENPVVLPSHLSKKESPQRSVRIPIVSSPLNAMVPMSTIHPGMTPEYWANVFRHQFNSPNIELCYAEYPTTQIPLSVGHYDLDLIARGVPGNGDVATLHITVDEQYKLIIEIEGVDQWSKM